MNAPSIGDFQGKRVLVVESEALMPFTIYRAMESLGADIVGPGAFSDDVSLLAGSTRLDGALVDRRIGEEERNSIHRVLRCLHVPFVEVCGRLDCISGDGGCYTLSDAEHDLPMLGRALFGGFSWGARARRPNSKRSSVANPSVETKELTP